jgi:fatty acid synthase subunit beta
MPTSKSPGFVLVSSRLALNFNGVFSQFGAKTDGSTCDLADMTYAEVNARLVRLMYVAHEKRWIDPSLRNLVGDWIRRVEERLSNVNSGSLKVSALQSYSELNEPEAFLKKFLEQYPAAEDQILASADVAYFLAITQRPGQKVSFLRRFIVPRTSLLIPIVSFQPVPFIPVLDASFSIWFKKVRLLCLLACVCDTDFLPF